MFAGIDPTQQYNEESMAFAKALRDKTMQSESRTPAAAIMNMLALAMNNKNINEQGQVKKTEDAKYYADVLNAKPLPWNPQDTQLDAMAKSAGIASESNPRLASSAAEMQMQAALKGPELRQKEMESKMLAQLLGGGAQGGMGGDPMTALALINPQAATALAATNPELIARKNEAEEKGKLDAKNKAAAPGFLANATQIKQNVNDLIGHPGFETSVGAKGPSRMFGLDALTGAVGGTDAADFDSRLDQVKGQQFLQAFENLKGGGQITEKEGTAATAAISRMNKSQSENEFRAAAKEFNDIVDGAMQRARQKAGITITEKSPVEAPQGGIKFLGFE